MTVSEGSDRRGRFAVACPGCGSELLLHQPDLELGDRLLGTCAGCKGWYVVDGRLRVVLEVSWSAKVEKDEGGA